VSYEPKKLCSDNPTELMMGKKSCTVEVGGEDGRGAVHGAEDGRGPEAVALVAEVDDLVLGGVGHYDVLLAILCSIEKTRP
jgi:hypothetical protein